MGRSFKQLLLVALLLCPTPALAESSHAISVYGDIKYPANFKHFDYANPDAPKGGEFIMPEIGTFDNLNPYILKGHSAADTDLLFDTLMRSSGDETSTSYGLIAESVEFPENNKWIIFNLRPEAKFSDGSALTADDVVFSFNTLKEKGHPMYKVMWGEISSAEKLGAHKVRFNFSNPKTRELKLVIGGLPVISKAYYDKVEFNKTTLTAPLGSGPYLVDRVDAGRSITYKRNPNYWAKDLPVNKGSYNFDKIRHEYYLDVNVAIQAFKSGAVDLRYENIAKNWANSYNIAAVKDGRIIKEKIQHQIPTGMQGFLLNQRREKFADIRVRKALNLALDFEWMNKNLFYSSYTRTNSYFSNSIYASSGIPEGKELKILEKYKDKLPPELFTQSFELPKSDASGRIRDRLVEARELLKEAGWKIKDGKLQNGKGENFTLEILLQQGSSFERVIGPLKKNFAVLGIDASYKAVDTSQYKQLIDNFDFDTFILTLPQSLLPGTEQIGYWHSSTADIKGGQNYMGIKNPVIDDLISLLMKSETKDELVTRTRALDRVLLWNYYVIPNWYIGSFRILYWNKFGRPETLPKYDSQFGLNQWWAKSAEEKTN